VRQRKLVIYLRRFFGLSLRPLLRLAGCLLLATNQSFSAPPTGYVLEWSDEFWGSALDKTKWDYRALGSRNNAINTKDAVSVGGGVLVITTYTEGGVHYTGMIGTENLYMPRYGYIEARIQFNTSPGQWSAFWMNSPTMGIIGDPKTYGTEIDIVEHRLVNKNNENISDIAVANIHWDGYGEDHKTVGSGRVGSGLSSGWHLYALEWKPNVQNFYYDGVLVWSVTNSPTKAPVPPEAPVSQRTEYLILSSEVRENGWAGTIPAGGYGDRTSSGTTMLVDYVRSYSPPSSYSLAYKAGPNGNVDGVGSQNVAPGGTGTAVTAVADSGYYFIGWSDGSSANPRTESNVASNISVTAIFEAIPRPTMTVSHAGIGRVGIFYHGVPGVSYVLEQSGDLTWWTNLVTNRAPATGWIAHTNPIAPQADYFRVRAY
jgi:beta-glucanase (GH16 family)